MKILVIFPYFYPHFGGTERYIEELYLAVRKLDKSVKVDVLTYNTEKVAKETLYKGMHIYRLECWEILSDQFALPNYLELIRLARKLKSKKYDVVNSHTRFFDNSWWAWLLAKYLGATSVLTDHCAGHPEHSLEIVRMLARIADSIAIPILGRVYDRVTVVSLATKKFWLKFSSVKTEVIAGGVNPALFLKSKPVLKFSKKDIVITFVGRMIPAKGPQLLLQVAKDLTSKFTNLQFVFVGSGSLLAQLSKQESERIHFLGQVSREKVNDILKSTDILVHPSTHHEGLPSVILEAGAAVCAVIATNQGGTGELIQDGKTGLIIKPAVKDIAEGVSFLIKKPEQRKLLAINLNKRVIDQYSWPVIAKRFLAILLTTPKKQL